MLQILDVNCAGVMIPQVIPNITKMIVTFIKIVVPIILIILGMIDLAKAVIASKEDEIKKAQQLFIKRLIAAVVVFLIVVIVQVLFNLLSSAGVADKSTWTCIKAFIG